MSLSRFEVAYLPELQRLFAEQLRVMVQRLADADLSVEVFVDNDPMHDKVILTAKVGSASSRFFADRGERESFLSALDAVANWVAFVATPRGDVLLEAMRDGLMADEEWAA